MGGDLYKLALISSLGSVLGRMRCMKSSRLAMMDLVGVFFQIREQPIIFFTQDTTGLLCSEMQKGMFEVVTVVKGWGNPSREMKCLCSPKFS